MITRNTIIQKSYISYYHIIDISTLTRGTIIIIISEEKLLTLSNKWAFPIPAY